MRIPTLKLLAASKSGFMSTSDLIVNLMEIFKPDGHDLEIMAGRADTYFSQKVRNMVSHRTSSTSLIKRGLVTYDKGLEGLHITDAGRAYVKA